MMCMSNSTCPLFQNIGDSADYLTLSCRDCSRACDSPSKATRSRGSARRGAASLDKAPDREADEPAVDPSLKPPSPAARVEEKRRCRSTVSRNDATALPNTEETTASRRSERARRRNISKSSETLNASQTDEVVFLGSQTCDGSQAPKEKPRTSRGPKHSSKRSISTKLPDDASVPKDGKSSPPTSPEDDSPLSENLCKATTTETERTNPSKKETKATSAASPSEKGKSLKPKPATQAQDTPIKPDSEIHQPPENLRVTSHVDSPPGKGTKPNPTTQDQDKPKKPDPGIRQPESHGVPSHVDSVIICNGYWTTEDTPTTELASDDNVAQKQKIDSLGVKRISRVSVIDLR